MIGQDYAQLAWLVLLLIALSGFLIVEFRADAGRATRQMLAWALIFVGVIAAAGLWTNMRGGSQRVIEGKRIEIPVGLDGHFHLVARLNDNNVRFVVDTGATGIALSRRDAERIGFDPGNLAYIGEAVTANGRVRTAPVTIDRFEIGEITDRKVRADVVDGDLDGSLLGMSYLSRFSRVGFEGDLMVLER